MALTPQPARVPIGYFNGPNGKPVSVFITNEWLRYLGVEVFKRIGGTDGSSTTDLEAALAALAAGEMVTQPFASQALSEVLLQPSTQAAEFGDVMQPAECCVFNEMIFQG